MRPRLFRSRILTVFALAFIIGCSQSDQTEVGTPQAPAEDPTSHDSATASTAGQSESAPAVSAAPVESGKIVGPRPSHGDATSASEASDSEPSDAPGSDSDDPGRYQIPQADRQESTGVLSHGEHAHGVTPDVSLDEGPRKDQDDPDAPILLSQENEDDSQRPFEPPMNSGRPPTAVPKSPAEIKQAAEENAKAGGSQSVKLDMGRDPTAKRGSPPSAAERRVTDPDNLDAQMPAGRSDAKVDAARPAKAATGQGKKLADLPISIRSLDKDGDGQIGLYEWPRKKISQFTEFDGDKDGFLTPQELHDGAVSQVEKSPPAKPESTGAQSEEASGGEGTGAGETENDQGVKKPSSNPSSEQEGP